MRPHFASDVPMTRPHYTYMYLAIGAGWACVGGQEAFFLRKGGECRVISRDDQSVEESASSAGASVAERCSL